MIKIGILETGLLRDDMKSRFDPYPVMFRKLFEQAHGEFEYRSFGVLLGEMPESIRDCDAWLITGSRHGVYDELDWMAPLGEFVRDIAAARLPLIGICFGHQIIAHALGGRVVKSERGWGLGLHRYRVARHYPWMREGQEQVAINAFHQDQVVEVPDSAEVFLSSDFCPCAGLVYGDSIISVQGHPEFGEDYEVALLETYRGNLVPDALANSALASIRDGAAADRQLLARWFSGFLLSQARFSEAGSG